MCLIFFAVEAHPDYPLIVAANRDEAYARPTLPLHHWENSPIIAGKDLTAGGTWMGITRSGRFAAITNYRDPCESVQNPLSRGLLVKNFLESQQTAPTYLQAIANEGHRYQGFNLVVGQGSELWYFSNRADTGVKQLPPGIHGLSNHLMDTPWPKVSEGKSDLDNLLSSLQHPPGKTTTQPLFGLLNHREPAPDSELPNTGIGRDFEKELSPRFIISKGKRYGTRSSTVLMMAGSSDYLIAEKNWDNQGNQLDQATLRFNATELRQL